MKQLADMSVRLFFNGHTHLMHERNSKRKREQNVVAFANTEGGVTLPEDLILKSLKQ